MKHKAILSILIIAVIIVLQAGSVLADGCPFVDISSADLEVRATAQRAVVWQRHGTWEIHITPVFERYKSKAAWVVPFPVLPTVEESSADFFNQLEILTAPMFLEACISGGGCGDGGGRPSSSGGGTGGPGGRGAVEIWDQGTVGELDYVIISARHQVFIVDWLKNNGYYVTPAGQTSLKKFEAEGTFFFAAKVSETADPAKPITPVRFVLPDLKSPVYPLVLTGLGVPSGASLELSLWLIAPGGSYYVPTSHRYDTLAEGITTLDEYTTALRRFYLTHPPGTLAMLYSQTLAYNERINKRVCLMGTCVSFSQMGIEAPEKWCGEIDEIAANKDYLFRYQGRLGPVSLREDLAFGLLPADGTPVWTNNTYLFDTCAPAEAPGVCGTGN